MGSKTPNLNHAARQPVVISTARYEILRTAIKLWDVPIAIAATRLPNGRNY